jgi:hypothetical protein
MVLKLWIAKVITTALLMGIMEGGQKPQVTATFDDSRLAVFAAYRFKVLAQHENMSRSKQRGADDPGMCR